MHNIYVNYVLADEKGNPKSEVIGTYLCEDVTIEDDSIKFSWKLSEQVLLEDGFIAFAIAAKQSVDGVLKTKWYTTPGVGKVKKTIKDGTGIEQLYPDVLDNLVNRMMALEDAIKSGSEGISISVDSELSEESTNPVQNKVITKKVNELSEEIVDLSDKKLNADGSNADPSFIIETGGDSKNIFDGVWSDSAIINTGGFVETTNYITNANHMIVSHGKYLAMTIDSANVAGTRIIGVIKRYAFYDVNKNLLNFNVKHDSSTPILIPDNVAFVKITCLSSLKTREVMVELLDENDASLISPTYEKPGSVVKSFRFAGDDTAEKINKIENAFEEIGLTNASWSWWVTNTHVDKYGTFYLGYISNDGHHGIACRYPDGRVYHKNLGFSTNNDDHNAVSVNMLSDGRIVVMGTRGHSVDNKVIVYIAKEPYSISCEFEDKSFNISQPDDYTYKTCYSQQFIENDVIYNMFRLLEKKDDVTTTTWSIVKSTDFGNTWELNRFLVGSPYVRMQNIVGESTLKRFCTCWNPADNRRNVIRCGYVNLETGVIYDSDKTTVMGNMSTVGYGEGVVDDTHEIVSSTAFATIVDDGGVDSRTRLLAVLETDINNVAVLWARSTDNTFLNYKYNRYLNGNSVEIGESGLPFYQYSGYISGADFGHNADVVYYGKNVEGTPDGMHEIHRVTVEDNAIKSDVIVKASKMMLSRILSFDGGNFVYNVGHYNDVSTPITTGNFVSWELGVGFVDHY